MVPLNEYQKKNPFDEKGFFVASAVGFF